MSYNFFFWIGFTAKYNKRLSVSSEIAFAQALSATETVDDLSHES